MNSINREDPNRKLRTSLPVKFIYWLDRKTKFINNMETKRTEWLMSQFPIINWIQTKNKILDLACGMGYITNYIATKTTAEVWGLDIADYRTKEIKHNTKFNYLNGNAYHISFEDEYFDAVNIFVSLHHMWDPEAAIKEALRVLKVGGKLIILEDLINTKYSRQTLATLFIDNVINLSFKKNPNTNKTKDEWINLLTKKFHLTLEKEYSVKWGPFFKSLELGIFLLEKGESE